MPARRARDPASGGAGEGVGVLRRVCRQYSEGAPEWSDSSVCDLYRARWEIEVFFKQVKQTLRLSGFVGYSANAIRWQVWTALLVYVLLRFAAHLSAWGHSFTRLFAVVRAAIWERLDLLFLLRSYGTAGGSFRILGAAHSSWLPGFEPEPRR